MGAIGVFWSFSGFILIESRFSYYSFDFVC